MEQYSFVQPYKEYGSDCSYCRRPHNKGRVAYGFHTYHISPVDYETYLELGYLRSGSHVYKPSNARSCCPNNPVRIDTLAFIPSHSHRKLLKRIQQYLNGTRLITLPEINTDVFGRCLELTLEGRTKEAAEAVVRYRAEGVPSLELSASTTPTAPSASQNSSTSINRSTSSSLATRLGMVFLETDHDDDDNDDIMDNTKGTTKNYLSSSSSSSSQTHPSTMVPETSKKSKLYNSNPSSASIVPSTKDKLVPHAIPLYHPFRHISPDHCTEITDEDIQRSYIAHIIANVFHVYVNSHKSDKQIGSSVLSSLSLTHPPNSCVVDFTLTPEECINILQRSMVEEPSHKLLRSSSQSAQEHKIVDEDLSVIAAVCNAAFIITSILFDHRSSSSLHTASSASTSSSSSSLSSSVATSLIQDANSLPKGNLRTSKPKPNGQQQQSRIEFQRTIAKDIAAFLTSRCQPVGLIAAAAGPGYINISLTSSWPPLDLQRSTIYHAIQQEHTGRQTEVLPNNKLSISSSISSSQHRTSSNDSSRSNDDHRQTVSMSIVETDLVPLKRGQKRGSESSSSAALSPLTVADLLPLIPETLNITTVKTPLERKALSVYYRKQQVEREMAGKIYMKIDSFYQPGRDELDMENEIFDIENQEEELVKKQQSLMHTEDTVLPSGSTNSGTGTTIIGTPTVPTESSSSTTTTPAPKFIVTKLPPPNETEEERVNRIRTEIEQREMEEELQKEIEKSTDALEKMAADGIGNRMKMLRERAVENRNIIKEAAVSVPTTTETIASSSSSSSSATAASTSSSPPVSSIPLLPFGIGSHKLTVTLARPTYSTDSHELYARFNMALHRGKPSSQSERNFRRHLIDSPLVPMPAWKLGYLWACTESASEADREHINTLVDRARQFYEPLYPVSSSPSNTSNAGMSSSSTGPTNVVDRDDYYSPDTLLQRIMDTLHKQSRDLASVVVNSNSNTTTTAPVDISTSSSVIPSPTAIAATETIPLPRPKNTILEQCTELANLLSEPTLLPSDLISIVIQSYANDDKVLSYINMYLMDLLDPLTRREIELLYQQHENRTVKFGENAGDAVDKVFNNFPFPLQKLDSVFTFPECFFVIVSRLNDIAYDQRMEPGAVLLAMFILFLDIMQEGNKHYAAQQEYNDALIAYTEEIEAFIAKTESFSSASSSIDTNSNFAEEEPEESTNPGETVLPTTTTDRSSTHSSPPIPPTEPPDTSDWLTEERLFTRLANILDNYGARLHWIGRAVRSLIEEINHVVTTYSEGSAKFYDEQRRQDFYSRHQSLSGYNPLHPPFTEKDSLANLTTVAGITYQRNRPFPYIDQPPADDLFKKYFKPIYTPGALRHGAEPPPTPSASSSSSTMEGTKDNEKDHRIGISGWDLPFGYGSFFHEYRLDGVLIAVSVIDILPTRIASVYFFYDVDFRYLELGKLSALVEIWLVQQINQFTKQHPELSTFLPSNTVGPVCRHWDPNFYVHTCPQMSYKRQFQPMEIISPVMERGIWVPFDNNVLLAFDNNPEACLGSLLLPSHPSLTYHPSFGQQVKYARIDDPEQILPILSRMQQAEDNRAVSLLPTLLVQLRDGSLYPFGGLSERSKSICRIGLQRYVVGVGRKFAERTLLDPNGAASSGSQMEDVQKGRKARNETREAKRKALEEERRKNMGSSVAFDDENSTGSRMNEEGSFATTIEEEFLKLLQQSLQNEEQRILSSSSSTGVPIDRSSLTSLQELLNTLTRNDDGRNYSSAATTGTAVPSGYGNDYTTGQNESLDQMTGDGERGEEEEKEGYEDEG